MTSGLSAHLDIRIVGLFLVILSSSLHEYGHALAAHLLGDDTAKERGRMTINPLAHIDPFGSVILPFLMIFSGSGYIAYAKPVPFNPNRLRNPARDETLVALAGPAFNILQAVIGAAVLRIFVTLFYSSNFWRTAGDAAAILQSILVMYVYVNCSLAFFNLIPLPPLDGSKVVSMFVKGEARRVYNRIQRNALPIVLIALYFLPRLAAYLNAPWLDVFGVWMDLTAGTLTSFLLR